MKMDDMNRYFESKGFKVEREYHRSDRSATGGFYTFDISKGACRAHGQYEWPDDQQLFMDRLIRRFEEAPLAKVEWSKTNPCIVAARGCGKSEYIKELLNGIYGDPTFVFAIKDVIFNDPATIVLWRDGTKTVVKAENEAFDPEKGLAMAISKKALGNKGNYFETFKKWLPKTSDQVLLDALKKIEAEWDKFAGGFGSKGE